jgi:PelA/Pel-15E family pectate lyase
MRALPFLVVLSLGLFAHAQQDQSTFTIKTSADFLALHVSGTAPAGTTSLQYRLVESGQLANTSSWTTAPLAPGADRAFLLDLPLKTSRWSELEVRALKGDETLANREIHRKPRRFEILTTERIAALPDGQREAWAAYMEQSNDRYEKEYDLLAAECRKIGLPRAIPARSSGADLKLGGGSGEAWFASDEALNLVDAVISYQTPTGGWSKAVSYSAGQRQPGTHWTSQTGEAGWHYCGTLDNRSATQQIRFLSGVYSARKREDAKAAALRGMEWLLAAQFPNGGWPQNYPVEPGYHEAITLNDDAMTHALEVLLEIAEANPPFAFTDEALRHRARAAFDKGIACLAAAQVKVDGKLTVWCAQHDPLTLAPVGARLKEPPSLSGLESANVLKFLMRKAPSNSAVVTMIESALPWLDAHRIEGLRYTKTAAGKTDYVADPSSAEIYWARFYDIQTGKPIFAGAQDGIIYDTYGEMAAKNKVGYDYLTTKPREVIEKEAPRWRTRSKQE